MATKIEAYASADGRIFKTKSEADRHDAVSALSAVLRTQESYMSCSPDGKTVTSINSVIRETTIVENAEAVIKILQDYLAAR